MILQSLARLAARERLVEDPDYEMREVDWLVTIKPDGRLVSLDSLLQPRGSAKSRAQPRGPKMLIPRQSGRTSGDKAEFLVDKADYVCGLSFWERKKYEEKKQKGAAPAVLAELRDGRFVAVDLPDRLALYSEQVEKAAVGSNDDGIKAVHSFLRSSCDSLRTEMLRRFEAKEFEANHMLAFRLDGDTAPCVHLRPSAKSYWACVRALPAESSVMRQCLVTGAKSLSVEKHPPIKRVPGGTASGVAIVSFNADAFESYGFARNENAPVSREAAEAYTTALNRLLDPSWPDPLDPNIKLPEQRVLLSDDTAAVFWTDEPSIVPSLIGPALDSGEPEAAAAFGVTLEVDDSYGELLGDDGGVPSTEPLRAAHHAPWKGVRPADIEDAGAFRLLILSGGQGRAAVRAFRTDTVRNVVGAVQSWFEDIRLATLRGKPGLYRLLRSLAQRGDREKLPPNLTGQVFLAALSGRPLPIGVLEAAIRRCRSESNAREIGGKQIGDQKVRPERVALIKAWMNRANRDRSMKAQLTNQGIHFQELKATMNGEERNEGYLLGRMFACVERMQELALGEVGASVTDRYFSAACATPQAAFPRLLKTEIHHYRKAREGRRGPTARWLHKQIDELASWLVGEANAMRDGESLEELVRRCAGRPITGFPAFLPLPEQGLFTLGYHQQRAEFFRGRTEPEDKEGGAESGIDAGATI